MKVNTGELRDAFKVVDSVGLDMAHESSQCVRIQCKGTELNLAMGALVQAQSTVTGEGGGKWTAFIDRKILKTFLATASGDETEFFYKDKLIIKSGQRIELALHTSITGYEPWTASKSFDVEDEQRAFLKIAIKYIPLQRGSEMMEAINFTKNGVMASDGTFATLLSGSFKNAFMLSPEVAKYLSSDSGCKISLDKNGVGLVLPNGFFYEPRNASLDNYPTDKFLNMFESGKKSPALLKFQAESFLTAIKAAVQFLDNEDFIELTTKEKSMTLSVETKHGKFQKSIPVSGKGLPAGISIRGKRLIPWLEYVGDKELEFANTAAGNHSNVNVLRTGSDIMISTGKLLTT